MHFVLFFFSPHLDWDPVHTSPLQLLCIIVTREIYFSRQALEHFSENRYCTGHRGSRAAVSCAADFYSPGPHLVML